MMNPFADLRHSVRALAKAPAFTLAVVAVLALGIGATTAIFSIVYGVMLKPLPFAEPSRLVAVQTIVSGEPDDNSYPDFEDWRAKATAFDALGAYATNGITLTGVGDPLSLSIAVASGDLFRVLGVAPLIGRPIQNSDNDKGAAPVVVISERLWQNRFGRDTLIVGRAVMLDGRPFTVVGVMPAAFEFPFDADRIEAWIPIRTLQFTAQLTDQRGAAFSRAIGRLRPGRTAVAAQAELATIQAALAAQYPQSNARRTGVLVEPFQQVIIANYRLGLVVLFGAVGAVLLIACANVANLLLARGTTRRKELAVRAALGAGRGRLVRQLLTESLVLAAAGGAAGVLFALWGVSAVVAASPIDVPRLSAVHVDGAVLLFAIAASVLTGIVFGLAPAIQLSRTNTAEQLKQEGRGGSSGSTTRTRQVLVVAEMALSLVLLVSAGLLVRTLVQLQQVSPGFASDRAIAMFMTLSDKRYPDGKARAAFARRLVDELRTTPGVEAAALSTTLPLSGSNIGIGFTIEGRPADPATRTSASAYAVSDGYFGLMRIPVVGGRGFTERDTETAPPVIVINETMARRYWPNDDPIGRHVTIGYNGSGPREIVGIVADVKDGALSERPRPQIYTPFVQTPWPFVAPVVRTSADHESIAHALRAAIAKVDPGQATAEIKPLGEYVSHSVATPRFTAALIGGFAGIALLLAGVGLYGVMAYSVAQRRREIGIRMALGAQASTVRTLVVSEACRLGGVGLALGIVAALASTRVLRALLFGVTATDPLTFAVVAVVLATVLVAAAYLPARRATHVDPVIALRAE